MNITLSRKKKMVSQSQGGHLHPDQRNNELYFFYRNYLSHFYL